ncbi:MAG: YitT family protein [Atopobiaceae bacterium]|nr:YitT family protein [Atopobiaceae bacterium]
MSQQQRRLSLEESARRERISKRREAPSHAQFFALLNLGLFLTALGIVFFKAPNHFALGGTSGISIILSSIFPQLNVGYAMWAVNAVLVVLGIIGLDRNTMGWTIFSSFALSAYVTLLGFVFPLVEPLTSDTLLELIFAVMLPAIGSAIVFNIGASTGGTDILAMLLKRHSSLQIGWALLVSDAAIVGIAAVLFGPRTGLYCILGLLAKTLVVDSFIEGINNKKVCTILSTKPDDVVEFIINDLNRSASLHTEQGAYSGKDYTALVSVLNRREAAKLRDYLRKTDPHAFITIVNSSEIIGKGFRSA